MNRFDVFLKNAKWSYVGEALPRIGALLIVPLWSSRVPPADYGKWILALSGAEAILILSGQLFGSFMTKSLYRNENQKGDRYFGLGAAAMMGLVSIASIFLFLFAPSIYFLVEYWETPSILRLIALYLPAAQLSQISVRYLQARVRYNEIVCLNFIRWALNSTVLLVLVVHFDVGYISWGWAYLFSELCVVPLSLYYLRGVEWTFFKRRLFRFALRYGIPNWINHIFTWGQSRGSRFILSHASVPQGVGYLGIAQNLSANYQSLLRPLRGVATQMIGISLEKDLRTPFFMEFFHLLSSLAIIVAFLVSMFLGDLMKLLFSKSYHGALVALPMLIFGACFREIYNLYYPLMFRQFKVWFDSAGALVGLASVTATTILLVPKFGFLAAAFADLVGSLCMLFFAHWYSVRISPRRFFFYRYLMLLLSAFAVCQFSQKANLSVVLRIGISAGFIFPVLLVLWMNRDALFPLAINRFKVYLQKRMGHHVDFA